MIVPDRYVIILGLVYLSQVMTAAVKRNIESHDFACKVSNNNTTLDCSNLNLTAIPNDIPKGRFLALNMSHNDLQQLEEDTFAECCSDLEELDLSSTQMTNLKRNLFKNLHNVKRLFLKNNSISKFDHDTFANLEHLERLDLSGNPLQLDDSFIVNSNLEELNLDNCDIQDFPEKTFSGISQLMNLTLRGNPLDSRFDTTAFEELENLIKLQIPDIPHALVRELCPKLVSIDSIFFDGYNVSCYLLVALNGTFEEAIVPNDAPVDQPFELPILSAPPTTTTTSTTTEVLITKAPDTTAKSLPAISNVTEISTSDHTSSNITSQDDVNHAKVDIDTETLNFILVGIIVVTVIGIVVGLICRADVCGIKTKMCRSKKNNRREPEDTVSPFEEIPLNTVNSNGKSAEGQG